MKDGSFVMRDTKHDLSQGAKLTFTFNEGLIVQIQPNGDCVQTLIENPEMPKDHNKGVGLFKDQTGLAGDVVEKKRIITVNGEIIRFLDDDNFIIYYPDGTITTSDKRRGIWYTINPLGVKRTRKLKDGIILDDEERIRIEQKVDPETNAIL